MTSTGMWIVELGDSESECHSRQFDSTDDVYPYVREVIHSGISGRVCASEDVGERSWFARKILCMPSRMQAPRFALEWSDGIGSLIFLDDAVSEYRAIDSKHPIEATQEVRTRISHGELAPHPSEECLSLDRALKAIEEFLQAGQRPDWLEYRYVR
jgi:hypothetical protein